MVNSYSYSEAQNIQDLFYQIDGSTLKVGMVTVRPGILIGKGGLAFNRALEELKKEFINDEWGFTDIKLEIIENKFSPSQYHYEDVEDY